MHPREHQFLHMHELKPWPNNDSQFVCGGCSIELIGPMTTFRDDRDSVHFCNPACAETYWRDSWAMEMEACWLYTDGNINEQEVWEHYEEYIADEPYREFRRGFTGRPIPGDL